MNGQGECWSRQIEVGVGEKNREGASVVGKRKIKNGMFIVVSCAALNSREAEGSVSACGGHAVCDNFTRTKRVKCLDYVPFV